MKTDLFIPKTIVVGCQKRSDTYLGELGYIIYKDNKNVLRKEKSWQNWRDHSIEPREFSNEPTNGFTFNKGVQRYGDWNSTGRSLVRVFDPRGYEFEVSIENLIGLLMHSDVSKRDIVQDCVYAWYGTELILLPTNSEVYQESLKYTEKQDMKVGAKELGIGYTYELKKERTHVVYLGRHDLYDIVREYYENRHYSVQSNTQVKKKPQHVFYDLATKRIEFKSPTQYLARVVSEECHPQYADFLQTFFTHYESQPIVKVVTRVADGMPADEDDDDVFDLSNVYSGCGVQRMGYYLANNVLGKVTSHRYVEVAENQFLEVTIEISMANGSSSNPGGPAELKVAYRDIAIFHPEPRRLEYSCSYTGYSYERYSVIDLPELNKHSPIVQAKIKEIQEDFRNALAGWTCPHYDNFPITDDLQRILKNVVAVGHKHRLGKLYGVLQNGHTSTQYIY